MWRINPGGTFLLLLTGNSRYVLTNCPTPRPGWMIPWNNLEWCPWDSCRPNKWTMRRMNLRNTSILPFDEKLIDMFNRFAPIAWIYVMTQKKAPDIHAERASKRSGAQFLETHMYPHLQSFTMCWIPHTYCINPQDVQRQVLIFVQGVHVSDVAYKYSGHNYSTYIRKINLTKSSWNLSQASTECFTMEAQRFMQCVQVNDAEHGSSGNKLSASLWKTWHCV